MSIDWKKLTADFPNAKIKPKDIKPKGARNATAQQLAFIDARDVMQRLDEVVGTANWFDDYTVSDDGTVICTLFIQCGTSQDPWIGKSDVGKKSEQNDAGDQTKAAFSDAFKRAAVKWGIGRSLYSTKLPRRPYDAVDKKWLDKPSAEKVNTDAPAMIPITEEDYQSFVKKATERGVSLQSIRKQLGRVNLRTMEKVEFDKVMKDWSSLEEK